MALYRFRLKDSASGEVRVGTAAAESPDETEQILLTQEADTTAFTLQDVDVRDLERKLKEGSLSGRDKALLFSHRQAKPYKIVDIKKGG